MADKNQIIQAFVNYVGESPYPGWYVGIASDPRSRLFSDHNVVERGGLWIYEDAGSESIAREVETHFLNLGADGGSGGGDGSSHYVYAYRKTSTTNEDN